MRSSFHLRCLRVPVYVSFSYDTQTTSRIQKSFTNFVSNSFENILCSKKKKRRRENMIFCIKGFCLSSSPVAVKITAKCGLCLACIFPYKESIFDSRILENFIQRPVYEIKKPTSIMKATAINESSFFLKLWMFWQDTRQNWNWL